MILTQHLGHLPQDWIGWGVGDNKKSLLRSSTNPQDYHDPSIAFGLPPLGLDWMGSRRQIKRVCCEAALSPRTIITPAQHLGPPRIGLHGEPETIKIVCCEAALTPRAIMTPAQHLGHLPQDWIGWGAGDNKKIMLPSSTNPRDYYYPSIAFGLPPLGLDQMGSRRQ